MIFFQFKYILFKILPYFIPTKSIFMKAMLFSAGLGTRLRPLTNDRPKALVEIQDGVTLLHHNIKYLLSFGIDTIVVNIDHFGEKILEELERYQNFGANIIISDERDAVLETGGGLQKAKAHLEDAEAVLLFNVDIISNINLNELLAYHQEKNALATLACRSRESSRYLLFDNNYRLGGWQNNKTGEQKIKRPDLLLNKTLAFSGIHIISPKFLDLLTEEGKYSITNTYLDLAKTQAILAYLHDDDYWFDVGNLEKLHRAKAFLNQ